MESRLHLYVKKLLPFERQQSEDIIIIVDMFNTNRRS